MLSIESMFRLPVLLVVCSDNVVCRVFGNVVEFVFCLSLCGVCEEDGIPNV